jgi:hypothetical protein
MKSKEKDPLVSALIDLTVSPISWIPIVVQKTLFESFPFSLFASQFEYITGSPVLTKPLIPCSQQQQPY